MNTAKIYQDSDGNDCSIWQMVRREPEWAANRIQEGEKALERERALVEALDEFANEMLSYRFTGYVPPGDSGAIVYAEDKSHKLGSKLKAILADHTNEN